MIIIVKLYFLLITKNYDKREITKKFFFSAEKDKNIILFESNLLFSTFVYHYFYFKTKQIML